MKNLTLKNRLINKDEFIDFEDINDNQISLWFNKKTKNFCLELNCEVVKSAKTWKTIENKLLGFGDLEELN